ncbi:MAG: hypothetical protein WA213_18365 [Terriglobales bacterium]
MAVIDKLFCLYLLLVLVFSLSRALQLALKLWHVSRARPNSSRHRDRDAADLLVARAIANKLARPNASSNEGTNLAKVESSEAGSQIVATAIPRFEYLWDKGALRVAGIKNLAILTLILSGLVLSCDLMRFLWEIQSGRYPVRGDLDAIGGPWDLLAAPTLGFAVSAILYAFFSFCSGALARRKAAWRLFVANARGQYKPE